MTVPKVGDILMLSQKALKIGRAFASCHKNAPSELQSVETEIGDLAKALRLLAETLHAESEKELFQCADQKVQDGIGAILFSCQRTVDDLDSLVDQYQVIKKHRTVGGFAIERSWTDLVLKSSTRLKSVVTPTVERTDITYHANATLDRQIDQVHRIVQDLTLTPQDPQTPPIPPKNPARSPTTETPNPRGSKFAPFSSPRHPNNRVSLPRFPSTSNISPNQPTVASLNTSPPSEPSPTETISMARTSDSLRRCASRTSDFSFGGSSIRYSSSSYASSEAGTSSAGWQSPAQFSNDYFLNRDHSTSTKKTTPLPRTPEESGAGPIADNRHSSLHSLPVIGLAAPYELQRTSINISQAKLSPFPSSQPEIMKLHRSATTTSQKTTFEREAFRNSAVLCDV
ncbi:hypothetical protein A1F94_000661 [Pyrenophora tritici-repentis]|nr:hypothetical protein A1F94_000661 [Pyrenophora tritici-repentis]